MKYRAFRAFACSAWGILGASWGILDASWRRLGGAFERRGGVLGCLRGRLGTSWSNMGTQRSIKGEKLDPNLANMNQIRFKTSPSGFPGPFESRFQGCPNPRKTGLPCGFYRAGIIIIPAL